MFMESARGERSNSSSSRGGGRGGNKGAQNRARDEQGRFTERGNRGGRSSSR